MEGGVKHANNTQQNVADTHTHTGGKPNLLDHINLFPSKEEGRIPGERKVLSERQTKQCSCVQGKLFEPFL